MAEATFQLDWLTVAICEARRRSGTSYQKRLFVIWLCNVDGDRLRRTRHYTSAMYMRHLLLMLQGASTVDAVRVDLERRISQPPTSNTGVNSDESTNEPVVTVL